MNIKYFFVSIVSNTFILLNMSKRRCGFCAIKPQSTSQNQLSYHTFNFCVDEAFYQLERLFPSVVLLLNIRAWYASVFLKFLLWNLKCLSSFFCKLSLKDVSFFFIWENVSEIYSFISSFKVLFTTRLFRLSFNTGWAKCSLQL